MPEPATFDPEAFRQFEHDGWNRLYEGYHLHWEHLTTQIVPRMLDATEVSAGARVLDIACGPGYVSAGAANRGATTTGIDLSENMVALASQNHPKLSFRLGDAEDLPFDNETFDVVLINFGILHFPDADQALSEAFRVLKTGGRLGFTAWSGPENSAIGIAMNAVAREGSTDVDLPMGTPIFRFADHAECARTLEAIGFIRTHCANHLLTWSLPSPDALMDSLREATARTSALLNAQAPSALPAIKAAMTEACRPFDKGGQTELPMPAVLTVATKS